MTFSYHSSQLLLEHCLAVKLAFTNKGLRIYIYDREFFFNSHQDNIKTRFLIHSITLWERIYSIELNLTESSITNTCRASYIKLWNNTHYIGIFILFLLNKEGRGGVGGGLRNRMNRYQTLAKFKVYFRKSFFYLKPLIRVQKRGI